jgi:HlyD family secretion protein
MKCSIGLFAAFLSHSILPAMVLPAAGAAANDAPPANARTVEINRGTIVGTVEAQGTIEPSEVIDLGVQISGRVKAFGPDGDQKGRTVDYSSRVKAGQVLLQLDDDAYRSAVELQKANLERAKAELMLARVGLEEATGRHRRIDALKDNKAVSAEEAEGAALAVKKAEALVRIADAGIRQSQVALDQAERELSYTRLTSPIDGVVIARRVNLGQAVSPKDPAAFLIAKDLTKMEIWASVDEEKIGQVRVGQAVSFSCDAFAGQKFTAKVSRVRLEAMRFQDRTQYTVEMDVDNPRELLRPYMTAHTRIATQEKRDVLMVPNAAVDWMTERARELQQEEERFRRFSTVKKPAAPAQHYVWVQDGETFKKVSVKVGTSDGQMTEITGDDLKEGMRVVVGEKR